MKLRRLLFWVSEALLISAFIALFTVPRDWNFIAYFILLGSGLAIYAYREVKLKVTSIEGN